MSVDSFPVLLGLARLRLSGILCFTFFHRQASYKVPYQSVCGELLDPTPPQREFPQGFHKASPQRGVSRDVPLVAFPISRYIPNNGAVSISTRVRFPLQASLASSRLAIDSKNPHDRPRYDDKL
ncbi:uncharacterized protein TrAtP1_002406 [Trichoderma atroviride]|uniref:uncharacterized protein n=1 Tax=Hypocrea atroviridis TaxID=63577 RepID=UPI0033302139|nr:hypothetical protein TrAtP1_002406 [Trichoderma atroviride]